GRLEGCDVRVTGRVPPEWRERVRREAPPNVTFTGFLPDPDYVAVLNEADVIVVLVTVGRTQQQGGAEAVAVEKPLVTSDWPVLRDYFEDAAVFVQNEPAAIAAGIGEALDRRDALSRRMRLLKTRLDAQWRERIAELRALLFETDQAGEANGR
ncbi:MAG: glycosyltransferase, partial [Lentisphaerae bacterium]|nr:glycosyltransferase [Lentisphaerota bacterium]